MESSLEIVTHLEWNDNGLPVNAIATDARVELRVQNAVESECNSGVVMIRGNRSGLIALAEQLLAVAHTDVEGYHQHFDSEFPPDFLDGEWRWQLIIERSDQRAIRRSKRHSP